jgi:ribokinase
MSRILVVGSMNMDIVTRVSRHPLPGETIHGKGTVLYSGGKGANQAVAASRSGAAVSIAGGLGDDFYGKEIRRLLSIDGIDQEYIRNKQELTGIAIINIDDQGENNIILSKGANGEYGEADLESLDFSRFDAILLQNEIPWNVNRIVIERAASYNIKVFMNPAPAFQIERRYFPMIGVLILNELEARELTKMEIVNPKDALAAAKWLTAQGVEEVIVTIGERGSLYVHRDGSHVSTPAFQVKTIDTTAAGDTFIGAFAAKYLLKQSIEDCLMFASAAAALAVSREGAQSSIPTAQQVSRFISEGEI